VYALNTLPARQLPWSSLKLQRLSNPGDSLFFSIVGWHALTLPQNPAILRQSKMDMLATLLAIGIDPNKAVIFHQDDVGFWSLLPFGCFFLAHTPFSSCWRIRINATLS
jgi:tryptophanyl-tRNA synthetase